MRVGARVGAGRNKETMLKTPSPRPNGGFILVQPLGLTLNSATIPGAGEWEGTGQLNKIPFIKKKLKNNANVISSIPRPALPPTLLPGLGPLLPWLCHVITRRQ